MAKTSRVDAKKPWIEYKIIHFSSNKCENQDMCWEKKGCAPRMIDPLWLVPGQKKAPSHPISLANKKIGNHQHLAEQHRSTSIPPIALIRFHSTAGARFFPCMEKSGRARPRQPNYSPARRQWKVERASAGNFRFHCSDLSLATVTSIPFEREAARVRAPARWYSIWCWSLFFFVEVTSVCTI